MPSLVPRRFVEWNSRAIGSRFCHEGRWIATERERDRGGKGVRAGEKGRDEARTVSLLSQAELITSRTAKRAKQQSGYLSRIHVRVHALVRQILGRGPLGGQAVRRIIHHIVEKRAIHYDNVSLMID